MAPGRIRSGSRTLVRIDELVADVVQICEPIARGKGIGFLALAWNLARKGRFDSKNHWGISGTVMYWHFVDVVWVFFYPALYLVGS